MAIANFTIYNEEAIINNITEIKEFSETKFILKINDVPYEILGTNLVLKEVTNDNKTIKITGKVVSIIQKNITIKKNTSFIKKLFS